MKKSKLIKTVIGAGALLSATPIVATSCNNNEDKVNESQNYIKFAGNKLVIDHALNQADLNAMQPQDYQFSDGVIHKAIFVDGIPYRISYITEMQIGNCGDETLTIPSNFLMGGTVTATSTLEACTALQKLDLHGIKTTTIENTPLVETDYWDLWCPNMLEIKVPTLVKTGDTLSIPDYFLSYDDPEYLARPRTLQKVDLTGFKDVTHIGSEFLYYVKNLTDVNLTALTNVTSIGDDFLSVCISLEKVDLSSFSNVTSIGNFFLASAKITSIDLSPLSNLEEIQTNFLDGCTSLESIKFPSQCDATAIGTYFLRGCSELKSIDLSCFTNVKQIGTNFLYNCTSLTSVDMSKFTSLTTSVGNNFLYNCTSLTDVNMGTINPTIVGPSSSGNTCFEVKLTQDEYNNYDGIKLTVDSTVENDWDTATQAGGKFAPIAWSGSGSVNCRKWKA